MIRRSFVAAFGVALLSLAACGRGAQADDETQPAGSQPAPTAQQQAAPQTGPNTPQATDAQAPQPPSGPVPGARTYAACVADARAKAKSEGERDVLERTCSTLPGAPKR